jgi:FkbM family methyltransferase
MSLPGTLAGILRHPLNRGRSFETIKRFLRWQFGVRLLGAPVAVPFVESTRMLVQRGMTGATGIVYQGLPDFWEMGFVLHALRPRDLFFDVGANVGSYTMVAAATGASCVAFEPVPETFRHLRDNIALNDLENVALYPIALGAQPGEIMFSAGGGPTNHALGPDETEAGAVPVEVWRLDDFCLNDALQFAVVKIDAEGFEVPVIEGGQQTLSDPTVKAVILELLNGQACRYGYDEWALHGRMLSEFGFHLHRYDPLTRELTDTDEVIGGNNLYVRDAGMVRERLSTAPMRSVHGVEI